MTISEPAWRVFTGATDEPEPPELALFDPPPRRCVPVPPPAQRRREIDTRQPDETYL